MGTFEEHALISEARGLLRWLRRRWWVAWLFLIALSNVWTSAGSPEVTRSPEVDRFVSWSPTGTWRRDISIGIGAADGERDRKRVIVSSLLWPEGADDEKSALEIASSYDALASPSPRLWNSNEVAVFLHGSPGSAEDFGVLASELSAAKRRCIGIDLPGFGDSEAWPTGYSIRSHAEAVIAALDKLGVRRFHLVGWSQGGGVALNIIDLLGERAGDRVASLTLMASIGVQEGEGSGSFCFEHFKYAAGFAGLVVAPELVPHFGLLGDRHSRYAFIRNFWDTDQRPLRGIMERTRVPTLILQGRYDSLVPEWVAEESHRLIPTSRLVVFNANHFLPFMQAGEAAQILESHFARHDAPGAAPLTGTVDLAPPVHAGTVLARVLEATAPLLRAAPWWLDLGVIVLLAWFAPVLTLGACATLCAFQQLDPFLLGTGVWGAWGLQCAALWLVGRVYGGRARAPAWIARRLPHVSVPDWMYRLNTRPAHWGWSEHFVAQRRTRAPLAAGIIGVLPVRFVVARLGAVTLGATFATIVPFIFFTMCSPAAREHPLIGRNWWLDVAVFGGGCAIAWAAMRAFSLAGLRSIRVSLARVTRHEFWPMRLFYGPLYVYLVPLSIRHRGLMTPSCCNPGIENGGGLVGESKSAIMRALARGASEAARGAVLPTHLIESGPDAQERADRAQRVVSNEGLRFPVVLKPDEGQRGHAVRVIRSSAEIRSYFEHMTRDAVLQPYHPGPCECGILWARSTRQENKADSAARGHARAGFIFSITRKEFPVIVGDGKRTLEALIDAHPRFCFQSGVYLERFADQASRVLAKGEPLRLAVSGNHCQGTLFRDGADLITPALEDAIDALAAGFPDKDGSPGGLDFGRFDVRYTSDEDLRAGRGFAVVELNGTFSESTNLYDPSRSVFWSYSVLFRQWRLMYALGEARRDAGAVPMTARALIRAAREHFDGQDGSAVAD